MLLRALSVLGVASTTQSLFIKPKSTWICFYLMLTPHSTHTDFPLYCIREGGWPCLFVKFQGNLSSIPIKIWRVELKLNSPRPHSNSSLLASLNEYINHILHYFYLYISLESQIDFLLSTYIYNFLLIKYYIKKYMYWYLLIQVSAICKRLYIFEL